jgi:hypothetical protein
VKSERIEFPMYGVRPSNPFAEEIAICEEVYNEQIGLNMMYVSSRVLDLITERSPNTFGTPTEDLFIKPRRYREMRRMDSSARYGLMVSDEPTEETTD